MSHDNLKKLVTFYQTTENFQNLTIIVKNVNCYFVLIQYVGYKVLQNYIWSNDVIIFKS